MIRKVETLLWKTNMSSLTPRQFVEILVEKCPSYGEAPPSCPLSRLRSEPDILKRKENVAAMNDEEVEELYRQHLQCVCRVCGN